MEHKYPMKMNGKVMSPMSPMMSMKKGKAKSGRKMGGKK